MNSKTSAEDKGRSVPFNDINSDRAAADLSDIVLPGLQKSPKNSLADLPPELRTIPAAAGLLGQAADSALCRQVFCFGLRAALRDARPTAQADSWKRDLLGNSDAIADAICTAIAALLRDQSFLGRFSTLVSEHNVPLRDFTVGSLLKEKAVLRPTLRDVIGASGFNGGTLEKVFGVIVPILTSTLEMTSRIQLQASTEHDLNKSGTMRRLVRQLSLPWISPALEKKLGICMQEVAPASAISLLKEIDGLHWHNIDSTQKQFAARLQQRFQRHLAETCGELLAVGTDSAQLAQCQALVRVFKNLFNNPSVSHHPFMADNDSVIIERVLQGLRCGSMQLVCLSCPDYSGQVISNERGEPNWAFDFRELGRAPGIVAQRGFAWIQGWHAALTQAGVACSVLHLSPSFEVQDGFLGSGGQRLSAEQAFECLRASNVAIQQELAKHEISVEVALFNEVVPAQEFEGSVAAFKQHFEREFTQGPETFRAFVDRVFKTRAELYQRWHSQNDQEDPAVYADRVKRNVIMRELAEHASVATLLTSEKTSLLLGYDSALLSEVVAVMQLPLTFGFDAKGLAY